MTGLDALGLAWPPRHDARFFQDSHGVYWTVFEVPPDPRAGIPRSLVFDSTLIVRRVRSYPTDWRSLDKAALGELSWQR